MIGHAAAAAQFDDGRWLAAWSADSETPAGAYRVDVWTIDPDGKDLQVALTLAPAGISIPFDDPSVSGALRAALASEPRAALNQPTYSTTASSSWLRVRQTRSAISSVLKLSTNYSASALS